MAESSNVIFLSEAERKSWEFDTHGTVINNFIDFKLFDFNENNKQALYRKNLGINSDEFVILFLGGLAHHKGADLLIKAVGNLIARYPNIKILMPGSIALAPKRIKSFIKEIIQCVDKKYFYGDNIDFLISEFNLQNNIIRLPFNPVSIPFFAASDIVVFPASEPHFARPIIEAEAMKKAVIASDFPVMRELVEDEVTGFLIDSKSVNEFALCIEKLILSPALKQTMGEKGYHKARVNFDSSIQTNKILDVYATVLSQ
jgi:glycosyltransferase involved in cell wall biosynthesis